MREVLGFRLALFPFPVIASIFMLLSNCFTDVPIPGHSIQLCLHVQLSPNADQRSCLFCCPVRSSHHFLFNNFAAQLLSCFTCTLNCRFPTSFAPYAILSCDQLTKPDRRGECASKPPPQVVSLKCIGMYIDANAHRSVNTRIRIECALQVVCEQAQRSKYWSVFGQFPSVLVK